MIRIDLCLQRRFFFVGGIHPGEHKGLAGFIICRGYKGPYSRVVTESGDQAFRENAVAAGGVQIVHQGDQILHDPRRTENACERIRADDLLQEQIQPVRIDLQLPAEQPADIFQPCERPGDHGDIGNIFRTVFPKVCRDHPGPHADPCDRDLVGSGFFFDVLHPLVELIRHVHGIAPPVQPVDKGVFRTDRLHGGKRQPVGDGAVRIIGSRFGILI